MSNYNNNCILNIFKISKGQVNRECLKEVFEIDSDFFENEEYFREDTVGTEAERCAIEIFEKYEHIENEKQRLESMADEVAGYSNGVQTFIVGNDTYSGDYKIEVVETEFEFILVIAYVG